MSTNPNPADLTVVRFRHHAMPDPVATQKEGRPIYKDIEVCDIFFAGKRENAPTFPAHEICGQRSTSDGFSEEVTYAMKYSAEYQAFKNGTAVAGRGTPLEELPFMKKGKILELKALNIHTAEALVALDGQRAAKNIGMNGPELIAQAKAYLDNAAGSADVVRLASENGAFREQLAAMQQEIIELRAAKSAKPKQDDASAASADDDLTVSPFWEMDDQDIKLWIKEATGESPKGNPSHETLVRRADEVNAELAAKKAQEAA